MISWVIKLAFGSVVGKHMIGVACPPRPSAWINCCIKCPPLFSCRPWQIGAF